MERMPLNRLMDDGPVVMDFVRIVSSGIMSPDEDFTEINFKLSASER